MVEIVDSKDDVRNKVRAPKVLEVTLFIPSITTHISRQTTING